MTRHVCLVACLLGAMLLAAGSPADAHKAHQHGVVKMDVALEGNEVSIGLEMPLDTLVGFERRPRTDAERRAAADALARIREGGSLFRFDAAARCSLREARVEAPVLDPASGADAPAGGHADLDAHYVFGCEAPARLATLEVLLFDAFRRVERVQVQAVLPKAQGRAVLRRTSRIVQLAP